MKVNYEKQENIFVCINTYLFYVYKYTYLNQYL